MLVNVLKFVVDEGEAEAITLALEKGWRLIVDDRKARVGDFGSGEKGWFGPFRKTFP
jgi:hypothetical protein